MLNSVKSRVAYAPAIRTNTYAIDRAKAYETTELTKPTMLQTKSVINLTVFNHNNKHRVRWEYLVMAIAAINCFNVPIEIAIEPEFTKHTLYKTMTLVTDLVFMLDIAVIFNTTYESKEGVII